MDFGKQKVLSFLDGRGSYGQALGCRVPLDDLVRHLALQGRIEKLDSTHLARSNDPLSGHGGAVHHATQSDHQSQNPLQEDQLQTNLKRLFVQTS